MSTVAASLIRALNEPIDVRPYDPGWATGFAAESERLTAALPLRFACIAHIGSSAVPGMMAKPIIDMLAALADWGTLHRALRELQALGYHYDPASSAQDADRRWLLRHADGRRTHHLHVVAAGSRAWHDRVGFRARLAADPLLRGAYLALKYRLVLQAARHRERYTAGKVSFIRVALSAPPRPSRPIRSPQAFNDLIRELVLSDHDRSAKRGGAAICRGFRTWIARRDPPCVCAVDGVALRMARRDDAARAAVSIPPDALDAASADPVRWETLATIAVATANLLSCDFGQSPRKAD